VGVGVGVGVGGWVGGWVWVWVGWVVVKRRHPQPHTHPPTPSIDIVFLSFKKENKHSNKYSSYSLRIDNSPKVWLDVRMSKGNSKSFSDKQGIAKIRRKFWCSAFLKNFSTGLTHEKRNVRAIFNSITIGVSPNS
jgi:hypothetical protein